MTFVCDGCRYCVQNLDESVMETSGEYVEAPVIVVDRSPRDNPSHEPKSAAPANSSHLHVTPGVLMMMIPNAV